MRLRVLRLRPNILQSNRTAGERVSASPRLGFVPTATQLQEKLMKTIGDKLEPFKVVGVKPGFNNHEENGESSFEDIT